MKRDIYTIYIQGCKQHPPRRVACSDRDDCIKMYELLKAENEQTGAAVWVHIDKDITIEIENEITVNKLNNFTLEG